MGAQSRDEKGHAGPDVRGGQVAGEQGGGAGNDNAVGIAESDIGPHKNQAVGEIHPGFVHPVM